MLYVIGRWMAKCRHFFVESPAFFILSLLLLFSICSVVLLSAFRISFDDPGFILLNLLQLGLLAINSAFSIPLSPSKKPVGSNTTASQVSWRKASSWRYAARNPCQE